jgi:adenylylsulfate kinase
VLVPCVSPYKSVREENRRQIGRYVEVYVDCPLPVLVERDTKGLYKKALAGEIGQFTGVSDPYEQPLAPEITIHSDRETPEQSMARILGRLVELGYLAD